jgi:hypothetical protein
MLGRLRDAASLAI